MSCVLDIWKADLGAAGQGRAGQGSQRLQSCVPIPCGRGCFSSGIEERARSSGEPVRPFHLTSAVDVAVGLRVSFC